MNRLIEITVSDSCNMNCSYCFEHGMRNKADLFDKWKPYILKACSDVESGKTEGVDGITLTFWGGEPFLRYDRMLDLIGDTSKYGFVSYHVYTNGTLETETKAFVEDPRFKAVAGRFSVQVSYDGSPCNETRRGYSFADIGKQAEILRDAGANVSFKATLSYDDIELFPELWDSYAGMIAEWPDIKYSPTLDSVKRTPPRSNVWEGIVKSLCRREYGFYSRHGRFLMSWFDDEKQRLCRFGNRVFLHTDGIQYVCHGCPYSVDALRFRLGSHEDGELRFTDRLDEKEPCRGCDATYCVYCNMAGMPGGDLKSVWNAGVSRNGEICRMYRVFGKYRRALVYAILKNV